MSSIKVDKGVKCILNKLCILRVVLLYACMRLLLIQVVISFEVHMSCRKEVICIVMECGHCCMVVVLMVVEPIIQHHILSCRVSEVGHTDDV